MEKISVVINTYNRASVLEDTLLALYYLEYPNFEVIVVNGPSTDSTEDILEKYKNDIKIARCPERNLSMSRNIGIAMASGEYVAFIDDDAVPDRKWLNKLITGFNSPEIAAVGSDVYDITGILYQCRRILSDRFTLNDNNFFIGNLPATLPYAFNFIRVIGVNSIFRRNILLKVGGFDEQYDYFLDETDLCARLIDAGYCVNYVEGADVYHKFAPSDIRDNRKIALDYTSVVKNAVYYINNYKNIAGIDITKKAVSKFISAKKDELLWHLKHNNIKKIEYLKSIQTMKKGLKLGEESVKRGHPLLMTENIIQEYKTDFKKFSNFFNSDFTKKKTIVILTSAYYPIQGGVVTLAHSMAVGLIKKGHNVHIITCDESYQHPTVTFEKGIWVHRIKTKQFDFDFLRRKTPYDINMSDDKEQLWRLMKLYTVYEELCAINEKYKVDIVHSFLWDSIGFYPFLDEKFICVTTLITPALYIFQNSTYSFHKFIIRIEKFCLENAKYIVGDSKYIIEFCKQQYKNMPEANLIYLGMEDKKKEYSQYKINNPENFKFIASKTSTKPTYNSTKKEKIEVLFLGRLEERKGVDLLLTVIPEICEEYENVIFRIVGDDKIKLLSNNNKTYKKTFLQQHKNLVKRGRVIFEGIVEDTNNYYNNCDVFVAPSRFESFGLIYLEAMMFSKPVVGTKVSAIPEVVEDGVTGLLMQPENTKSLKQCLVQLIENKELRKKMGEAGRQRYERFFTDEIMANNLIDYYNSILRDKS